MTTNKLNFDGALKIATTLANNHSKYPKTPRSLSKFSSQWVDKIDISSQFYSFLISNYDINYHFKDLNDLKRDFDLGNLIILIRYFLIFNSN